MKDLTYGWKRYQGEAFVNLSIATRKKFESAVVWDRLTGIRGQEVDLILHGKGWTRFLENEEDPNNYYYIHTSTILFVRVKSKVGRFIP